MTDDIKSLIRKAALSAAFLIFANCGGRLPVSEYSGSGSFFDGRTVRCVIDTGEEVHRIKVRRAGFNYELLKKFAEAENFPITIDKARNDANYLDSLAAGSIDILVRVSADSSDNISVRKTIDTGPDCVWLLKADRMMEIKDINIWLGSFIGTKEYDNLKNRFYRNFDPIKRLEKGIVTTMLSPYDDLIKRHADAIGWDWRMLAALIYKESKFSITAQSSKGAVGLMQMIPNTASYYGITDLLDPEQNIAAGSKHLARIQKTFSTEEFSDEERINFTLGSYNAGESRIAECRRVIEENGTDNTKWEEIIKTIGILGEETIVFVDQIREIYRAFCEISPDSDSSSRIDL